MPEGHTIRRLADALGESFAGRRVRASSPQGRFADGAQVIDAAVMGAADAAGKHLFCDFDNGAVLHVHLGLIGRLDLHQAVAQLPAPLGQVRLRLWADEGQSGVTYADLRGATVCEVIGEDRRTAIIATLGPDPSDRTPIRPGPGNGCGHRLERSATCSSISGWSRVSATSTGPKCCSVPGCTPCDRGVGSAGRSSSRCGTIWWP